MSGAKRKVRAAAARPGTVAADRRVRIADSPQHGTTMRMGDTRPPAGDTEADLGEVFDAEDLATMPIVIRWLDSLYPKVWRDGHGEWWRRSGYLRVAIDQGTGKRSFIVYLPHGSTRADLDFLLNRAKKARNGALGKWWIRIRADWADELTFRMPYTSYGYADPYRCRDASPEIAPCTEALCPQSWHELHDLHILETIERRIDGGSYCIQVVKEHGLDAGDPPWVVELVTTEFWGTPEETASLVNDLQWAHAECERANGKLGRELVNA